MNKINTNKPFAEGMENADTGDTTNNVDDSAPNNLGDKVTYEVLTDLKAFCADGDNKTTKMIWNGEICEGDKIKWNSMKSLAGTTRSDQPDGCEWKRSDYETDIARLDRKLCRKLWSISSCYISSCYIRGSKV